MDLTKLQTLNLYFYFPRFIDCTFRLRCHFSLHTKRNLWVSGGHFNTENSICQYFRIVSYVFLLKFSAKVHVHHCHKMKHLVSHNSKPGCGFKRSFLLLKVPGKYSSQHYTKTSRVCEYKAELIHTFRLFPSDSSRAI